MPRLIPCNKPEHIDPDYQDDETTVNGHRFIGVYDTDGNYYEHDLTTDTWYKLIDS